MRFPLLACKRVLSPPRPIGHDCAYCGRSCGRVGGRRRLLARLHLRWPLHPLVTSPTRSRLSHQALAHQSVDLLAEDVALLAGHARKRVLSQPRPIGHVWVYSGRITEMLRERLDRNSEPLTQRRRARAGPSCFRGAPLPRAGNPGSQRRTHQGVTVGTSGQGVQDATGSTAGGIDPIAF